MYKHVYSLYKQLHCQYYKIGISCGHFVGDVEPVNGRDVGSHCGDGCKRLVLSPQSCMPSMTVTQIAS